MPGELLASRYLTARKINNHRLNPSAASLAGHQAQKSDKTRPDPFLLPPTPFCFLLSSPKK
jgi:hypothetical protein